MTRRLQTSQLVVACLLIAACGAKPEDKPLTEAQKDAIARAAGKPSSQKVQSPSALVNRLAGAGSPGQGSLAENLVRRAKGPVIESPFKQPRRDFESPLLKNFPAPDPNAAPAPTRTPYPKRQLFEDLDWMKALPPPADEVPGVRIGWYLNGSIAALESAIDQNKPVVIILGEPGCADCVRLANALRCSAVDRLAGEAVFAFSLPSREKGTSAIAGSLNITSYPTITIIEPESRMLIERHRISGYFDATTLGRHLEEALWRVTPRLSSDPELFPGEPAGPPASPRAARPPTAEEAAAGAKQRGLVHGPPAPTCK